MSKLFVLRDYVYIWEYVTFISLIYELQNQNTFERVSHTFEIPTGLQTNYLPTKEKPLCNVNLLKDALWNKTGIFKIYISPLLCFRVLLKAHYLNLFFLHVLISSCINYFSYISCVHISVATSCTGIQHPISTRRTITRFSPRKYEGHCHSHNSHTYIALCRSQ
jgi:hypothetical protein